MSSSHLQRRLEQLKNRREEVTDRIIEYERKLIICDDPRSKASIEYALQKEEEQLEAISKRIESIEKPLQGSENQECRVGIADLGNNSLTEDRKGVGETIFNKFSQDSFSASNPTLAIAIESFKFSLKDSKPNTRNSYYKGCKLFLSFISEAGYSEANELLVESLPASILKDYYQWLVKKCVGRQEKTILQYLYVVRSFFNYLSEHNISPSRVQYTVLIKGLPTSPHQTKQRILELDYSATDELASYMYSLTGSKEDSNCSEFFKSKRRLSAEEVRSKQLQILRDRAIIVLLYRTGMRREELFLLNREDILEGRAKKALIASWGSTKRLVEFDVQARKVIQDYLNLRDDTYSPLFIQHGVNREKPVGNADNIRLSEFGIWSVVRMWSKKRKLKLTTKDFRYGKISTMLDSGVRLQEVYSLVGHFHSQTFEKFFSESNQSNAFSLSKQIDSFSPQVSFSVRTKEKEA